MNSRKVLLKQAGYFRQAVNKEKEMQTVINPEVQKYYIHVALQ